MLGKWINSFVFWTLLYFFLFYTALAAPIDSTMTLNVPDATEFDISTYVTTGAEVVVNPSARVYSEEMKLFFIIPDIPEVPVLSQFHCKPEWKWCIIPKDNQDVIVETQKLLSVMQKLFTYQGLNISRNVINEAIRPERNSDPSDESMIQAITKAGPDWYTTAQLVLLNRKINYNYSRNAAINSRQRRYIQGIIRALPYLKTAFVQGGKILKMFTKYRSVLPKSLQHFADLPIMTSEYSIQSKLSQSAVSSANKNYDKDSADVVKWEDFHKSEVGPAILYTTLKNQHNVVNLINYQAYFMGHMSALQNCRDGAIPLLFVPRASLKNQMGVVESNMGPEQEFVIKPWESDLLYNLKPATCQFDNDGGIVTVKTFLKPTATRYRLYEFQSIAFAWHNYTCDLGIPSGYVIKEEVSGMVYPVSQLDEETCQPQTTGLCKLPQAANADVPHHYCLSTLMKGAATHEVIRACPLTCREGTRLTTMQINQDRIAIAHLPKTKIIVKCDTGFSKEIDHNIDIGAVSVTLGCGCSLFHKNKLIASSGRTQCGNTFVPYLLDHLLPIQLTTLNEYVPDITNSGHMKFKDPRSIINYDWIPNQSEQQPEPDEELVTWKFPVWTGFTNLLQWVALIYIFYKYKMGPFAFIATMPRPIDAATNCSVTLPDDIYITIYVILGLLVFNLVSRWLMFVNKKCQKVIDIAIDHRASARMYGDNGSSAV